MRAAGRPPQFTLAQRREIKKIAKSRPAGHGLPFSRWSLARLADFLVAEGVVEDISHEGLRELLRAEGVSFQAVKTLLEIISRPGLCRQESPGSTSCMRSRAARRRLPRPAQMRTRRRHPGSAGAADGPADPEVVLPPHRRGPAPIRGARPDRRQDVRAREAAQKAGPVPHVKYLYEALRKKGEERPAIDFRSGTPLSGGDF